MVCNLKRTLDAGEIKIDDHINMTYPSIYENFLLFKDEEMVISHESEPGKHPVGVWNEHVPNPDYKPTSGWVKVIEDLFASYREDKEWEFLIRKNNYDVKKAFYPRFQREMRNPSKRLDMEEYTGCTPFYPCVMINISPNWKEKLGVITCIEDKQLEISKFKRVIETYLTESRRWSNYAYCIESGSTGEHLHAHIVAEVNPDLLESVLNGKNSHINKGNHTQQIRKIWKDVFEGLPWQDCLPKGPKGKYSIQRIVLRTEVLKDDKLEYLVNENKPEGHKNKYDLNCLERRGL